MKKICLFLIFVFFIVSLSAQTPATIYEIQYTEVPGPDNTYPSLYEGQEVITTGIVTAIDYKGYLDNFFISMPEGGAWRGVLVYLAGDTTIVVGDEVEITGTVDEYDGMTEISGYGGVYISVTLLSSGNPVPAPVVITTAELAAEESYEDVLVELNDVVVTQEQNYYGEWYVTDVSAQPCQIDDNFFYLDEIVPPIVINVGDEWEILRGIVTYCYDEYEMSPRTPDDMIDVVYTGENTVSLQSKLIGCYPNPFNPETTVLYDLVGDTHVTLSVYNIKGEKIKTLLNEYVQAGQHSVVWNGTDNSNNKVSSGIYFFEFDVDNTGGDYTSVKKVILMK